VYPAGTRRRPGRPHPRHTPRHTTPSPPKTARTFPRRPTTGSCCCA